MLVTGDSPVCYLPPVSCVDNLVDRSIRDRLDLFFFVCFFPLYLSVYSLFLLRGSVELKLCPTMMGVGQGLNSDVTMM